MAMRERPAKRRNGFISKALMIKELEQKCPELYVTQLVKKEIEALTGSVFYKKCAASDTMMFLMFLPKLGIIAAFFNCKNRQAAEQAEERQQLVSLGYTDYVLSTSDDAKQMLKLLKNEVKKQLGMRNMLSTAR